MRVAMLNPTGQIGGAERVLLAVLQALRMRIDPLEVQVLTLSDGPLLAEVRALGASAISHDADASILSLGESRGAVVSLLKGVLAGPRVLRLARRQREALRAFAPDIVHSFGLKTHLLDALAPASGPRVVWQVQDYYSTRRISRTLGPWAARSADHAVAISDSVAEDTRRLLPGLPTVAIENAIDTTRFAPQGPAADLDALAGLPPAPAGVVRVGLVATYARWKGHRVFLEAASRLATRHRDVAVRYYLVGGPIYDTDGQFSPDELKAHARALGIASEVGFVPFQADPSGVYRALDIVVHASTQPEPFGLVIAEAMSCGRAVVVSAAGGAADLFDEGVDALGHRPGDVEGLAEAIFRLASDSDLRHRLGRKATETAQVRFGMARYADEVSAFYRMLQRA